MTEQWTIRRLLPQDGLQWKPLRLKMLTEAPEAFNTRLQEMEIKPDEFWTDRAKAVITLILRWDGQDVGTIGLSGSESGNNEAGKEKSFCLVSFWIDPTVRGRGFGRALLLAAEELAKEAGVKVVSLDVMKGNRKAIVLYERAGYHLINSTEKTYNYEKRLDQNFDPA